MSKGSPIVQFRLTKPEYDQLTLIIDTANAFRKDEPYTVSSWIRQAITEKLAHLKRSRGRKKLAKSKNPITIPECEPPT